MPTWIPESGIIRKRRRGLHLSDEERPHRILELIQKIPFRKIISAIGQAPRFPVITIIIFIICGLFGKLIAPHDPTGTSFRLALTPPAG